MMKRTFFPRLGFPAFILSGLLGAVAAGPAQAADLQPYRGIYSAKLHQVEGGLPIADVGGSLAISFEKTCDGWLSAQQMALDIVLPDGRTVRQEVRFTAWESLDGASFRFAKRDKLGPRETGLKGSAALAGPGGNGTVRLEFPEAKTIALPTGTIFPVEHLRLIIAAAEAGKNWDSRILFEGSEPDGARRVTAFIGSRREPPQNTENIFGPLVARPGWPIRMAVFPVESRAAEPEYEVEVFQLDNGVISRMGIDLSGVKLDLKLETIEALPKPRC